MLYDMRKCSKPEEKKIERGEGGVSGENLEKIPM